jgi:hypothetical protein
MKFTFTKTTIEKGIATANTKEGVINALTPGTLHPPEVYIGIISTKVKIDVMPLVHNTLEAANET